MNFAAPNTMLLAIGSHTQLAVELNDAMAADAAAQARYLATYGEPWAPLPTPCSPVHTTTSLAATCR